jgi:phosphoadenosine phosphosulfate reductase
MRREGGMSGLLERFMEHPAALRPSILDTPEPSWPAAEPDLDRIHRDLACLDAQGRIAWAHRTFGAGLVMTSSFGAHSAALLHLATRAVPDIPVVLLDTGYLFEETYRFAEHLRERLDLRVEVYAPTSSPARIEALHGRLYEGDEADRALYHRLHKVEPLQRALRDLEATGWLAGVRADQTAHRASLRHVERQDGLFKVHPILDWTTERVEAYLDDHRLPFHPLYRWGYRSIGDVHSTRPTGPEEDPRDGRDLGPRQECGIHLPAATLVPLEPER